MTSPHPGFVLFVLLLVLALFLRPREQELRIDAVPAAACAAPVNPCLIIDCNRNRPRGGIDPDAGARDQRRIV